MKRTLSELAARNAKPKPDGKPKKQADGGGLYLLVNKVGKYQRYNYKFSDKYKTLSLGVYPDVGIKDARFAHEEARDLLKRGIDPLEYKKIQKVHLGVSQNNDFEAVGREWFLIWKDDKSVSHADRTLSRLENDVFPCLGARPIIDIEPPEILRLVSYIMPIVCVASFPYFYTV